MLALDVETGRELWRFQSVDSGPSGPLSTPTVDGDRVFAIDAEGSLYALRTGDGRSLWSCNLVDQLGAAVPGYGFSSSPLVEAGRVLVLAGGESAHNLVAFDKATGEVLWSVFHAALGSYSTPVVGTLGGVRQIVVPGGDTLYSIGSSGNILWTYKGLGYPEKNPLLLPENRIFISLTEAGHMMQLEREGGTFRLHEVWSTTAIRRSYSPSIYLDGSIYGFDNNNMTCLDARTGELRWREGLKGGSMILVDQHLIVLDALGGKLRLVVPEPTGYRERLSVDVFAATSQSVTPPSFASEHIFVRNQEEVVALKVIRIGVTAGPSKGPR